MSYRVFSYPAIRAKGFLSLILILVVDMFQSIFPRKRISSVYHVLFSLLTTVLIAMAPLSALAEEKSKIALSPEEQVWLNEHPDIVLATTTEYPPFVIKNTDGTHSGMLVDLYEEINQLLNSSIRMHIEDSWADSQRKAQTLELDGLAMGGKIPARDAIYNASAVVFPTYFSIFARDKNVYHFKSLSDLKGMHIGYKRGASTTRFLAEKIPSAIITPYDDNESMTQALLRQEIDVIAGWISYDYWRKKTLQGTVDNVLFVTEYPIEMAIHIRKDWPELITILNNAIAALHKDELQRIINKWFGEWPKASKREEKARIDLTDEERAWLDQKHTVRVRVGHNPPWNINTPELGGMSVEHLNIIGKLFGINFKFIPDTQPWIEGFKDIAGDHLRFDLYPSANRTPERMELLAMSENYLESPWVVFTRENADAVFDIEDLQGRTVSVERGYVMQRKLKTAVPGIDQVLKENTREALLAVSTGGVDAYVGNLIVTSHLIQSLGLTNIKVACPTPFEFHSQAMATRKEWAPLISIINKGLAGITEQQKAEIRSKYITVRYEYGITAKDTIKWGLIVSSSVSGLIFLFVFWNRTLKKRVAERTADLAESESRFRAIFEQAAVGIAHVSTDGHFMRLNQKFCDIVGYPLEELKTKTFQEITHPDDLDNDLHLLSQLLNGETGSYNLEKRYVHKDSSVVWINLTTKVVRNSDNTPKWFVSVIEDISDRIKFQEQLRKSYEYLNHLTQTVPDAIFSVSLPARKVVWCNDSYGVLGYEASECMGETTDKLYPSTDASEKFGAMMDIAIQSGDDIVQTEVELRRKSGEIFPADVMLAFQKEDKSVSSVTALVRDISDRKLAERELQQSHDFLKHLLSSIPEAVFYIKLPERVIVWGNDSYNIMGLGDDPEHIKGISTEVYFRSSHDFQKFGEVQRQAIIEGKPYMRTETFLRRQNGETFPAEVTGSFLKKEGEIVGITAIARDISVHKQSEKKLLDYQKRLKALASQLTLAEEQERHRIATELHDNVGQALALCRLQLASVNKSIHDSALKNQFDELSQSLLSAVKDTRHLIFELSSPTINELGLVAAVREWIELNNKPHYNLEIELVDKVDLCCFDRDQNSILFRSVRELLTNAMKYSRAGRIRVLFEQERNAVRITVQDNGIGFNPDELKQSVSSEGGLGLFSIEERMNHFGGSMVIDAKMHHGTIIILTIPYSTQSKETS